jgi:hypothetical protein
MPWLPATQANRLGWAPPAGDGGVFPLDEALHRAEQAGLDPGELAGTSNPPVFRFAESGELGFEIRLRVRLRDDT